MASENNDEAEPAGLLEVLQAGLAQEEELLAQLDYVLDVLRAAQDVRDRHGLSAGDIWNAVTARLDEQELRP
ncbi:MAG: hypothetical protein ACRDQZ_24925, partial [Mycobacteriales bacterium]